MLTKPEQVVSALKHADQHFDEAYRIYMAATDAQKAQEAIESLIDGGRKLLSIVAYQEAQIAELQKTVRNHLSEVV